jgi:signal transduction histidine kinase
MGGNQCVLGQYPINKLLPAEVATSASQLLQYQRYPVFSWEWWWRRAMFLVPFAIIRSVADGNIHGVFSHNAAEAFGVAWRCSVLGLTFVGGGTLLAVLIRHARFRQPLESVFVSVAIIAGFFLAMSVDGWADRYHTELMCAHRGVAPQNCPNPVEKIDDSALGVSLNAFVPLGLYFLFGGGLALISYFRERRSWIEHLRVQERAMLHLQIANADARLSVLQAQIEPHFLFNTLASLRSLVQTEPQRAVATIDALVAHLRATLPKMRDTGQQVESTLGQQLDICRSYLDVMSVRMGPRLTYDIVAPSVLWMVPFPPLMLLSLVENAIKHGIEPSPGPHRLIVNARIDGEDVLEVTVTDDGPGLREGVGAGVGLANVRAQLALRYGAVASLTLANSVPHGAIATLRVPMPEAKT